MWSRAQTKVSRKKARQGRKWEKFPTSLLPGFPPPPPPAAISSHSPLPKRLEQAYIPVYDD